MLHTAGTLFPEDTEKLFGGYEALLNDSSFKLNSGWTEVQKASSLLTLYALDSSVDDKHMSELIETVKNRNLMFKEWRGIHIFSRRLPKNCFISQIAAWQVMKKHPVWAEIWFDISLHDAYWDGEKATVQIEITGQTPSITLGYSKKPKKIVLNSESACVSFAEDQVTVYPDQNGMLLLYF